MLVICHCRRVVLDAVQQAGSLLGLGSLLYAYLVHLYADSMQKDKFHHRKFMWEADKKLNWDVAVSDKKLGDLLGITSEVM